MIDDNIHIVPEKRQNHIMQLPNTQEIKLMSKQ